MTHLTTAPIEQLYEKKALSNASVLYSAHHPKSHQGNGPTHTKQAKYYYRYIQNNNLTTNFHSILSLTSECTSSQSLFPSNGSSKESNRDVSKCSFLLPSTSPWWSLLLNVRDVMNQKLPNSLNLCRTITKTIKKKKVIIQLTINLQTKSQNV